MSQTKELLLHGDEDFLGAIAAANGFTEANKFTLQQGTPTTYWKEIGPIFLHIQWAWPHTSESGLVDIALIYEGQQYMRQFRDLDEVPHAIETLVRAAETAVANPNLNRSTTRFGKTVWDRWQRLL